MVDIMPVPLRNYLLAEAEWGGTEREKSLGEGDEEKCKVMERSG